MKHSPIGAFSALAALLVSTSAFADVTAEQVWQNWQGLKEAYGQTLTVASEVRSGDTLTVSGLVLVSEKDGNATRASIDSVVFRERGDGTVEVTMSPQFPVTLTLADESGTPTVVDIVVDQPGLTVVASGTEAATRYDIVAPTVTVTAQSPANAASPVEAQGSLALSGLSGNYIVTTETQSTIASTLQADSARLTIAFTDPTPETGGTSNTTVNLGALTSTTQGILLSSGEMEDMSAALASGLSTDSTFTFGSADLAAETTRAGVGSRASGSLGAGTVAVGLNKDRFAYDIATQGMKLTVSGGNIPFPELVVSYSEAALNLLAPMSKTDTPQDFKARLQMADLAVSDEVWAMFDPAAALPRDPATVVIDTSGKGRWLLDPLSAEDAAPDSVPFELTALDVSNLTLRAVGASVVGMGGFTFDNSDTTTYGGVPAPTGKLDLTITGANALLDRLSQTGLLPQDQVMGARMMMGLFARPGEGPDTLTSTLEFKDKGFFANGQQLQ
jgi:Uncharacterized protein conserved in bacteria (DUF2125)